MPGWGRPVDGGGYGAGARAGDGVIHRRRAAGWKSWTTSIGAMRCAGRAGAGSRLPDHGAKSAGSARSSGPTRSAESVGVGRGWLGSVGIDWVGRSAEADGAMRAVCPRRRRRGSREETAARRIGPVCRTALTCEGIPDFHRRPVGWRLGTRLGILGGRSRPPVAGGCGGRLPTGCERVVRGRAPEAVSLLVSGLSTTWTTVLHIGDRVGKNGGRCGSAVMPRVCTGVIHRLWTLCMTGCRCGRDGATPAQTDRMFESPCRLGIPLWSRRPERLLSNVGGCAERCPQPVDDGPQASLASGWRGW
jgi:hypothetical protein